jgi:hypothetical protein
VQLKKLRSATLVAAKLKAVLADMRKAAQAAGNTGGVVEATAGNLTPLNRFTDDTEVPSSTRYEVPQELIDANCEATDKEANAMDAWDQEIPRLNATLKKEGDTNAANAGTSTGETNTQELEDVDLGGSQQTTVSVSDASGAAHK